MTRDRWQQVKRIIDEALEHSEQERAPFVDEACAGDLCSAKTRSGVESAV